VRWRGVPALALLLAACGAGGSDDTPQAQCARQANDDPKVLEIYSGTSGYYTFPWSQRDELLMARRQAELRCMRAKGLVPPGGVQPVVPR